MFDKLIDTVIYATPTICDIISRKYPVHLIAIVIFILGVLCTMVHLFNIRKGDFSVSVSAVRAVFGCLTASYSAAGHPALICIIWTTAIAMGFSCVMTSRKARIQEAGERYYPATAIGRIKRKKEISRVRRFIYRNQHKTSVPIYYIKKIK